MMGGLTEDSIDVTYCLDPLLQDNTVSYSFVIIHRPKCYSKTIALAFVASSLHFENTGAKTYMYNERLRCLRNSKSSMN